MEAKPKVYLFNNNHPESDWNHCYAMAEDGNVFSSHICSSRAFLLYDLHDNPEKKEVIEAYYPDGYELVIVSQGKTVPSEVFKRNQELRKAQ